jgi:hypothetical protein
MGNVKRSRIVMSTLTSFPGGQRADVLQVERVTVCVLLTILAVEGERGSKITFYVKKIAWYANHQPQKLIRASPTSRARKQAVAAMEQERSPSAPATNLYDSFPFASPIPSVEPATSAVRRL